MKQIAILGATGSIGRQAIEVLGTLTEGYEISVLSAHSNVDLLIAQANRFRPKWLCFSSEGKQQYIQDNLEYEPYVYFGEDCLSKVCKEAEYDILLNSVLGISALKPTLEAIRRGKRIALSNKEMLVCAGRLVMSEAAKYGAEIIPVDSEHSAIFQSLMSGSGKEVEKLILTSSGGAFRDIEISNLESMTPKDALLHPNWNMGDKITIDCATMVNKGYEVIEAMHLFAKPLSDIEVVIHRQSIVHSMVQYVDGSVIAQLGCPDMRLPIQYAFTYPQRLPCCAPKLDFSIGMELAFKSVDMVRYPCFGIALECAKAGGLMGAALNAADQELVRLYLEGRISFTDIAKYLDMALATVSNKAAYCLEDVFLINDSVGKYILDMVGKKI